MRLDKYLSLSGERSRSEAGKLIRSGAVRVDGQVALRPETQVTEASQVLLAGQPIGDSSKQ